MNARHVQEAKALQAKAIERLKCLELDHLSAADVIRYFVEATKLERTANGEPEAIEERRLTGKGGGPVKFSAFGLASTSGCFRLKVRNRDVRPAHPAPEALAQVGFS
jgi:hypothetical protein